MRKLCFIFIQVLFILLHVDVEAQLSSVNIIGEPKESSLKVFKDTLSSSTNLFTEEYMNKCPNDFNMKFVARLNGSRRRIDVLSFAAINELFWQGKLEIIKIKPKRETPPELISILINMIELAGQKLLTK